MSGTAYNPHEDYDRGLAPMTADQRAKYLACGACFGILALVCAVALIVSVLT